MKIPSPTSLLREERGAAAVEFVLILIPMVLLTLGAINLSLMIYTVATLNYAAEDAARCRAVKTLICTNAATTDTYARSRYMGPGAPNFAATNAPCGSRVVGTTNYVFSTGLTSTTIPLSASACYPA
ncbi:TadE/TadG family type IV pilus assembly protein [Phenylobacterium sp.]|uniref:TadE/TadG family type IV pilus assembly protein n=1 Tax=Phenylobacterium sp. TaxID=1871053 RepID=UPI002898E5C3|nr:TadE/TadG family type IV pilus assembly protein [Phenylobacterium sp.]